jgi:hypothetical protein
MLLKGNEIDVNQNTFDYISNFVNYNHLSIVSRVRISKEKVDIMVYLNVDIKFVYNYRLKNFIIYFNLFKKISIYIFKSCSAIVCVVFSKGYII